MIDPLRPERLYHACDLEQFTFQSTDELESLADIFGQSRVIGAVEFGIGVRRQGYNLFVSGPTGIGKHWTVRHLLQEKAAGEPTPSDWCYVNNFNEPQRPLALCFQPGQGVTFRDDVNRLVQELRSTIPAVFESDEYRARRQAIEIETKTKQGAAFEGLAQEAQAQGVGIARTPSGFVFAPLRNGEVMPPDKLVSLPEEERKQVEDAMAAVQEKLHAVTDQALQLEKEGREKLKELTRDVTIFAVGHLIESLIEKYQELPEVVLYLASFQQDVIENVGQFISPPESGSVPWMASSPLDGPPFLRRYQVNLIVDNSATHGAPLVYEDHPIFQNLIGQTEYVAQLGALSTDFNLIRGGALHRANGGYLMLDAQKVLTQPYAWDGLKRALQSSQIRIESLGQALGLVSTVSLEPQSIPLEIKVILIGERLLYYLLCQYDPEFNTLFKVVADFDDQMERSPANHLLYARMIATIARSEKLLSFDRSAVARTIEHSARLAGDAEKLSNERMALVDILRESDYWARQANRTAVTACDVQKAIDAQLYRVSRIRDRVLEEIQRGTLLINTTGAKVGQLNGLSVMQLGGFTFGQPNRITARVRLGKGEVVDIEREVALGGPIHSKGVLILSSFLGARYSADRPLSLHGSLVFEQNYSGVEGDSASSAELYALLSALADVPIKQSIAVTGSVNQYGEVQPIGGVNEKIEGFFDACTAKGLTGEEGVAIPVSNVKHLMLRRDIVDAVKAGRFRVYAVQTIDEGMEILTGVPAGQRDESGNFPEGTINQRIEMRLAKFAEEHIAFAAAAAGEAREHPRK
ncbi:MAG: ATP-dependent protease [Acidobacteria bacterium]|nr:MAG: ATP-dependent protease [Acidobacteriota bacterium]